MQLTIDSNEPLDKVTSVIGALYGVRLVVSEEAADTATDVTTTSDAGSAEGAGSTGSAGSAADTGADDTGTGTGTRGSSANGNRRRDAAIAASKAARRSAGRARRGGKRVDAAVVRQWAQEQGMTVSNRGQLPKAVLVAYTEQNG